ncbi:unnamed protein product [Camellia sinensis]
MTIDKKEQICEIERERDDLPETICESERERETIYQREKKNEAKKQDIPRRLSGSSPSFSSFSQLGFLFIATNDPI